MSRVIVRGALKSILTFDIPRVIIRGWRRAPTKFVQRIGWRRDMTAVRDFGSCGLRKINELQLRAILAALWPKCGMRFVWPRKPARIGDQVGVLFDFADAIAQSAR